MKAQLVNENLWTSRIARPCGGSLKQNRTGRTVPTWKKFLGSRGEHARLISGDTLGFLSTFLKALWIAEAEKRADAI